MAARSLPKHIVLTGRPGIGKTTLVQKTCEILKSRGIHIQGFYTEENRVHGKRTGFDVVTLAGQRGPLARVKDNDGVGFQRREYTVGQYSVCLREFEQMALATLKKDDSKPQIYVIDEIGKMECFSQTFIKRVQRLLDDPTATILCTIPIPKGKPLPLVEQIRKRKDAVIYEVSQENRNGLLEEISKSVMDSYKMYTEKIK